MAEDGLKRYFNGDCAREICAMLGDRVPDMDVEGFASSVDGRIGGLELKDRVLVLTEELYARLPGDYISAVELLVDSLGPELREDQGMFTESWFLMPVARLVEEYGIDHPVESLAAIEQITMRHTGEYAIRPYLNRWHDLTMEQVRLWSRSPSHNVRRLASEGIRPRLPWAAQFKPFIADPKPVVDVITGLIDDPSRYVRTSVANNLNDIAKDHPDYAVDTAAEWLSSCDSARTRWIVEKGLRGLIKKGHPGALSVVGAERDPHLSVVECSIDPIDPRIGSSAEVAVTVRNEGAQARQVIVDFQIYYRRANGVLRPATFKLGKVFVPAGGSVTARKRHSFKEVKTRTLYPGEHTLVAQANGTPGPRVEFMLRPR